MTSSEARLACQAIMRQASIESGKDARVATWLLIQATGHSIAALANMQIGEENAAEALEISLDELMNILAARLPDAVVRTACASMMRGRETKH